MNGTGATHRLVIIRPTRPGAAALDSTYLQVSTNGSCPSPVTVLQNYESPKLDGGWGGVNSNTTGGDVSIRGPEGRIWPDDL